jgi:hypothetical protein
LRGLITRGENVATRPECANSRAACKRLDLVSGAIGTILRCDKNGKDYRFYHGGLLIVRPLRGRVAEIFKCQPQTILRGVCID